jgi:hypothetical protein
MAVRTILASNAKVGDTIHFSFPRVNWKGRITQANWKGRITAFEVIVNGKGINNPEIKTTNDATNFVFQATAPGTYHFDITPITDGQRGDRRLNTLEVGE